MALQQSTEQLEVEKKDIVGEITKLEQKHEEVC